MKEIDRRLSGAIALAAVAIAIGISWFINRPDSIAAPTMAQVETEARSGGYRLIDAQSLLRLF